MNHIIINDIKIEIKSLFVERFLNKIEYPIAIVDFETFRNLESPRNNFVYGNDFEKIFSVAVLIFKEKEELTPFNLKHKKLRLFSKIKIPPLNIFNLFNKSLITYQQKIFKFLINKFLRYQVKSLVLLGARTETAIFKNYLSYHCDETKFKNKISSFFYNDKIFDLYTIWDQDRIINLPA